MFTKPERGYPNESVSSPNQSPETKPAEPASQSSSQSTPQSASQSTPQSASQPAAARDSSAGEGVKSPCAMIGSSITIKGELLGEEDLLVQGRVEGSIELKKNSLTVGKEGTVKANSRAKLITVEGKVEGDLYGDERIIVKQSGDVRGNLVAPRVSLEDGAKFKGSIDMEPEAAAKVSLASGNKQGDKDKSKAEAKAS